jgi:hypothetical protein
MAVPQGAAAIMGAIDVLHMPPPQRHDERRHRRRLFRGEEQVDVIGHQHIGVQRALGLAQRFSQPMQVAAVVFLAEKARLAVVAALHDVERNSIKLDTRTSGHEIMLARK